VVATALRDTFRLQGLVSLLDEPVWGALIRFRLHIGMLRTAT
jgi:hypothetical protein